MNKWLLLALLSGIVLCTQSMAQEYVIGVENLDYMPYYAGVNSEYNGYARELLDAFAKEKGATFIYKPLPVNRLFKSLLSKTIDFKFPDNPHWQSTMKKDKEVYYSDSVVKAIDGMMVLPERKGQGIKNVKKIGTIMGFEPWAYKSLIESGELKIIENPSFDGLLKQVIKGRVDGAYINPVVADYQLGQILKKPGALVFDSDLPFAKNDFLLSSLKHKDMIDVFNKFLNDKKVFIHSLKKKYGIKEEE